MLSAFLDNAPTYLVFFELAGGDAQELMTTSAGALAAISMGAVYMGALTYIGNAPNLMIYAIAVERGIKMPSFFGYLAWSAAILLPVLALVTFVFVVALGLPSARAERACGRPLAPTTPARAAGPPPPRPPARPPVARKRSPRSSSRPAAPRH